MFGEKQLEFSANELDAEEGTSGESSCDATAVGTFGLSYGGITCADAFELWL